MSVTHSIDGEAWKPVIGYEGLYEVSDQGRVRRVQRYRKEPGILRLRLSSGYCRVDLHRKGAKRFMVHRLVWEAFVGAIPQDRQINHRDGQKSNNHLGNLELVTASGNALHAVALGLWVNNKGERHGMAKLTWQQVEDIRRLYEKGMLQKELAEMFKVSRPQISEIVNRKQWA